MGDGAADHYQVLGIFPDATQEGIKAAYRRQALRFHPDKNNGSAAAAERFKRCNEAFARLSEPGKRTAYDRELLLNGASIPELARELLDDLLGGRGRRRAGRDLRYTLELSFVEATLGVSRRISFPVRERCAGCAGSGAAPGGTIPCPTCRGKGEVKAVLLSLPHRCGRCGGQGIAATRPCGECGGTGAQERLREYLVTLQPGVKDGEVKLVKGEGEPGLGGGQPGDLQVVTRVAPHPLLTRDGDDLLVQVPLSYTLAALGGSLEVPALEGTVRMRVPAGTQSGRTFRLAGMGPPRGGGRADILVRVEVETPVHLGEAQRRALEELEQRLSDEAQPRLAEFRAKLREHAR